MENNEKAIEKIIGINKEGKKIIELKPNIPFILTHDSEYVLNNIKGYDSPYCYVTREKKFTVNDNNEIVYDKVIEKIEKGLSRLQTKVYAKPDNISETALISSMDIITEDKVDNPNYAAIYSKSSNSDKTLLTSDRLYHFDYGEIDRNDLLMSKSIKDQLASNYLKERLNDLKQRKDYYIYYVTLYQGVWSNKAFKCAIDRIRLYVIPNILRNLKQPAETMLLEKTQYKVLLAHVTFYLAVEVNIKEDFISELIRLLSLEYGIEGVVLQRRLITKQTIRVLRTYRNKKDIQNSYLEYHCD